MGTRKKDDVFIRTSCEVLADGHVLYLNYIMPESCLWCPTKIVQDTNCDVLL